LYFSCQTRPSFSCQNCITPAPFFLFILFSFLSPISFLSSLLFFFSFLFFPTERQIRERPREKGRETERDGENQRELEGGGRWASLRLGRTTAPGLVGHGLTPVRPKSLEIRHFLGTQTVENPFFFFG
jgi:hypothetical protein